MPEPRASYLSFLSAIDSESVTLVMRAVSTILERERPDTLHILLSSKGGLVDAGIALHTFLTALPIPVVTYNTGAVNSIATVVYLAGRERVCAPSGTFLFHGVTSQFPRGAALSLPQLQERLSALVQDEKRVAALICQHTQLQEAEVRDFFHQGEVKDASFALAKGICHRLGTPQLPAGLPLHTIGPSRPTLRRPSH